MRLFFAIDLSADVKDRLATAIQQIPVDDPPWRWVPRDNLHITLKFLGETPERNVAAIATCAAKVCERMESFDFDLTSLSGFPNLKRPRVLFYNIERGNKALTVLAQKLDVALEAHLDIKRERRPFRAHLTIARVKEAVPEDIIVALERAPSLSQVTQAAAKLTLMKSHLSRKGPQYQPLKEFALKKSKC